MITFVIGGIRSGKSGFACRLAKEKNKGVVYIATCIPLDDETKERVEKHRLSRPKEWLVIEEPVDVNKALLTIRDDSVILIECLTFWVSNLLLEGKGCGDIRGESETETETDRNVCPTLEGKGYGDIRERVEELADALRKTNNDVILVSNEVGLGGISNNRLARVFTDILGETNQLIGSVAEEVYAVIAGIPMRIK